MSGSRRPHHKSRHGCSQCKRRRVKCDERPPVCGHCQRRTVKCSYEDLSTTEPLAAVKLKQSNFDVAFVLDPRSAGASLMRTPHVQRGRPPLRIPVCDRFQLSPNATLVGSSSEGVYPELCRQDIELLHHFVTATSFTFVPRSVTDHRLVELIPPMAQSNKFVLHGLLGISALHLATLYPDSNRSTYRRVALNHLSKGMSAFRTTVTQLNPKNANAIFTFSGISILWEFALLHPDYEISHRMQHPIDRLLQVFMLYRNVMALWSAFPRSFYKGIPTKSRIVQGIDYTRKRKPMSSEDKKILELRSPELASMARLLHDLNRASTTDSTEQQTYAEAIDLLHITFVTIVSFPGEWTHVLRWPFKVTTEFMELLQAKRPLALVLLGQYCVLLHQGTTEWWMKDWSQHVLNSIPQLLDEQWAKHLQYPFQAILDGHQPRF